MFGKVILSVTRRSGDRELGGTPLYIDQYSSHIFSSIGKWPRSGRSSMYCDQNIKNLSCHCKSLTTLREWSFLILGTGADDFLQGYETFCHHLAGALKF